MRVGAPETRNNTPNPRKCYFHHMSPLMLLHTWLHCLFIPVTNLCIARAHVRCIASHMLCMQNNINLCLFLSWFAKEANATINNDEPISWHNHKVERERYKCSETGNNVTIATRKACVRGIWNTPLASLKETNEYKQKERWRRGLRYGCIRSHLFGFKSLNILNMLYNTYITFFTGS